MRIFILIYFSFLQIIAHCQIWPKTYFPEISIYPFSVIECYDKGYLIGGHYVTSNNYPMNGSLIKMDNNADILWYKRFGDYNDGTSINDINQTSDGGYVITGSTGITDYAGDPFVMKLNSCSEREWCRIYDIGQERYDYGVSVIQVPLGYIVLV